MSHKKNGHYRGHREAGYPSPHPYGPPPHPYYQAPPPSYAAPPGYPTGPLPPPTYPVYSPRYPPSQNGLYYPPPMPYQPPGDSWPNQGPSYFHAHNNGGQQNFRQPFNGYQQNRNGGRGRKRKHSGGSQSWHEKKQQTDKRDLPENNQYSCDTCNRGFKTEEQYKVHVDAHVKCTFKGCEFIAHEKLVSMHVEHVHMSGYDSKLESSKNIEEWKEERRRNFPTKENIERKVKEQQEAMKRGEFVDRRGRGRGRGKFGNNWMDRRNQRFQGRGHFSHQDQQQGNQDWPLAEVNINTTEAPCNSQPILPDEEKDPVQTESLALPEEIVGETPLTSEDSPEEFPSHLEKPEVCQSTKNIPEHDDANVKPIEAGSSSKQAEKNRPQRHEGFQKRGRQRKEPLSIKLMERDIKQEMAVMLQIAVFFTAKFKEQNQSQDQSQISIDVV